MPWHVERNHESCPASRPHAVIKDSDGSVEGCHPSVTAANQQIAALYASERRETMSRNALHADVEWKAGGSPGELEGYASVFGNVDMIGDVVLPGAFKKTISDWRHASQPLPLIADHELSTEGLIGSIIDLAEDSRGLRFKARFSRSVKAQRIRQDILDGHMRGVSFTYETIRSRAGRLAGKAVQFLEELRVFEITLNPFPINKLAGITAAKAISDRPAPEASDYPDAESYCRASLIDENPSGEPKIKDRCHLKVYEPGGALNRNLVHRAANLLAGGRQAPGRAMRASAESKRAAARKLIRLYGELDEEPPDSIRRIAGGGTASLNEWLESMRAAIAIGNEFARKAAVDELIASYSETEIADLAADPQDAAVTATDAASEDGTSVPDDAYAVSFLANEGPSDGTPTGQPPEALPGPLADLERQRSSEQIDALEADIRAALEG